MEGSACLNSGRAASRAFPGRTWKRDFRRVLAFASFPASGWEYLLEALPALTAAEPPPPHFQVLPGNEIINLRGLPRSQPQAGNA
ncbi:hypothetical protein [Scytonema sp. PCC 10023]|uniref:hypothetical protein n=1 Tax=Scytonema sp. PCC 10023 TaxID=1680591 RepID=UPI0039C734B3